MQNSVRSFPRQGADSIRCLFNTYDFRQDYQNSVTVPSIESITTPVNSQYYQTWLVYRGGIILSKFIVPNRCWMFEEGSVIASGIKVDICFFCEDITLATETVVMEVKLYTVREEETLDFATAPGTLVSKLCGATPYILKRMEINNLVLLNPAGGSRIEDLIFILKISRVMGVDNFSSKCRILCAMVEIPLI